MLIFVGIAKFIIYINKTKSPVAFAARHFWTNRDAKAAPLPGSG